MYRLMLVPLTFLISHVVLAQSVTLQTKFERSGGTETVTYEEGISYLQRLDSQYEALAVFTGGLTDSGKPLHVAVLDVQKNFNPVAIHQSGWTVLLINNAIHPGEPDGVDASLLLLRNLLQSKKLQPLLESTVICIIPFYNIDGVLNRGSSSRANQNGPREYGFRGNARNYDLNRDFIKNDTKNARSFAAIFQEWQPDVFIDNHVSNGADYQYTLTYIPPQKDKLGGTLGAYLDQKLVPQMASRLKQQRLEMTPYVNELGTTPDSAGIAGFLETARYSTGYAALFQTIGFMPETHMLKPYKQRVEATYEFMLQMLHILQTEGTQIQQRRKQDQEAVKSQTEFTVAWQLDKTQVKTFPFKGYEARMVPSKVTTGNRLFYDRTKPYTKEIPYYNSFIPKTTVRRPHAYLIPQQWESVIERLRLTQVAMRPLIRDTTLEVEAYYITDYKTSNRSFEGHYLHSDTQVRTLKQKLHFVAGDWLIECNQVKNRYLIETLEPMGTDSFFNWNFFDSILQQKEGYSDYVFEDLAEQVLLENPEIKKQLEAKKQADEKFRNNPDAQLDFVYKHSSYYEPTHLRYPVFRIVK